jgi:hypothetical protein
MFQFLGFPTLKTLMLLIMPVLFGLCSALSFLAGVVYPRRTERWRSFLQPLPYNDQALLAAGPFDLQQARHQAQYRRWCTEQARYQQYQAINWLIAFCERFQAKCDLELWMLKDAFTLENPAAPYGRDLAFYEQWVQEILVRRLDALKAQQSVQPFRMPVTEVQAILESAKELWSDIVWYAGQTPVEVLSPYLLESGEHMAQTSVQLQQCLSTQPTEREQQVALLSKMIKHWAQQEALWYIISHQQIMAEPALIERGLAQFSQALYCQLDEGLRLLAQLPASISASR